MFHYKYIVFLVHLVHLVQCSEKKYFCMERIVYSVLLNRPYKLLPSGSDVMEVINKSLSVLDISVSWDIMSFRLLDKC